MTGGLWRIGMTLRHLIPNGRGIRKLEIGDILFDWEELEKEEDCRMKALDNKNEARGWA